MKNKLLIKMPEDKILITKGFNNKILCFYKDYIKGYDIYVADVIIASSVSEKDLEELKRILKCSCKGLLNN